MPTSTLGVHHVGLTVPDIQATRAFFVEALGFEQVGEKPAYPAVFVSQRKRHDHPLASGEARATKAAAASSGHDPRLT